MLEQFESGALSILASSPSFRNRNRPFSAFEGSGLKVFLVLQVQSNE